MQTRETPHERRQAIVRLLQSHDVPSQRALGDLLREEGFRVNQATLSRDLAALGVVKGALGYELPAQLETASDASAILVRALRTWLKRSTVAQNQVVLHTPPGGAQPLAVALDGARLPLVIGTLAGDDTILIICGDGAKARRVARELSALQGGAA